MCINYKFINQTVLWDNRFKKNQSQKLNELIITYVKQIIHFDCTTYVTYLKPKK